MNSIFSTILAAIVGSLFATARNEQTAKHSESDWRKRVEELCELDFVTASDLRRLRFSVSIRKGNTHFDPLDVDIRQINGYRYGRERSQNINVLILLKIRAFYN